MVRLALALVVLSSVPALAQTDAAAKRAAQPRTEIRFDDAELVDGTLAAPDVTLIDPAARPGFGSLIKVRTSFAEKVLRSVAELR